ncbi:unnamed protein product [Pylaiella littoralis]
MESGPFLQAVEAGWYGAGGDYGLWFFFRRYVGTITWVSSCSWARAANVTRSNGGSTRFPRLGCLEQAKEWAASIPIARAGSNLCRGRAMSWREKRAR